MNKSYACCRMNASMVNSHQTHAYSAAERFATARLAISALRCIRLVLQVGIDALLVRRSFLRPPTDTILPLGVLRRRVIVSAQHVSARAQSTHDAVPPVDDKADDGGRNSCTGDAVNEQCADTSLLPLLHLSVTDLLSATDASITLI